MAIEIVDFPMKMVIFHSYVNVYQRVYGIRFSPGNPWFSQIFSTDPAGRFAEDVHRRLVHPLGAHWDGPLPDLLLPGAEKKTEGRGDR